MSDELEPAEKAIIAQRLAELTEAGSGVLTPEAVVADAKDPKSPLHSRIFSDTDRDAAYQHRLELARRLIRSVRVVMTIDRRPVTVVGYVHEPERRTSGYVPTATLVNDRERALATVLREFERVEGIVARAREIADVLGLSVEMEELIANLQRFTEAIRRAA